MTEVRTVSVADEVVAAMVEALTAELALGGYADDESFGYSLDQLRDGRVHLVGAYDDGGALVGIGGVEVDGAAAELKRFYVAPSSRGSGVADLLVETLLDHARDAGAHVVRLETGDQQHAAVAFYRRHGFAPIPRFGPYVGSAMSVCMERRLGPG